MVFRIIVAINILRKGVIFFYSVLIENRRGISIAVRLIIQTIDYRCFRFHKKQIEFS
jgi:hypothetical protein